jgi:hypothetical protein
MWFYSINHYITVKRLVQYKMHKKLQNIFKKLIMQYKIHIYSKVEYLKYLIIIDIRDENMLIYSWVLNFNLVEVVHCLNL